MSTAKAVTAAVAAAPMFLAGCGTQHYDLPYSGNRPTLATIVQRVKCELMKAIDDPVTGPKLKNQHYVIGVSLSLTVNDSGELSPSLAYVEGPRFTFNAGFKLAQEREQNYTQNFYFSVDRLLADRALSILYTNKKGIKNVFNECPSPSKTNLDAELGLEKVVALAFTAPYSDPGKGLEGTNGEFGGYMKYQLTRNLNGVGPDWTFTHFRGPGGLATVAKVNTDQLTYGFAQSDGSKETNTEAAIAERFRALFLQLNLSQVQTALSQ